MAGRKLAAVKHPSYQAFQLAVGKRAPIVANLAAGNGAVQERADLTAKFLLERRNEIGEPRAESRDANGTDSFSPGVLIVGSHRENFLEQHLGGEGGTGSGKLGAAVAAEDAIADDGGGEGIARNAGEQRGLVVFQKRDSQAKNSRQPRGISRHFRQSLRIREQCGGGR